MTITSASQEVDTEKFNENFDKIFGKPKKVQGGSFVIDKETGELVPRGTYSAAPSSNAPMIIGPLKEFTSPIDGQRITSRPQLEAHNRTHGVTNAGDYNNGYIERKAKQRIEEGQKHLKKTRVEDIKHAIDKHSR